MQFLALRKLATIELDLPLAAAKKPPQDILQVRAIRTGLAPSLANMGRPLLQCATCLGNRNTQDTCLTLLRKAQSSLASFAAYHILYILHRPALSFTKPSLQLRAYSSSTNTTNDIADFHYQTTSNMCHSRSTDKLARFAARSFPDHFLRTLTDISAAPENEDLLHAANTPLLPGTERYYHLDGSRDDSSEIAFLTGDGRRLHLLGIPLGLSDPETQHDIANVSLLRRRIRLNGGLEEGQDEDFRFVVDGRGTWIVRLRTGNTPPDSAIGFLSDEEEDEDEEEEDGGESTDEYINLLDIPDVSPRDFQLSQFEGLHLTRRQRRIQRRRVANTRLYDITTRINILRGIPDASTRLPGRFISSLDDIENLADQLRTMPRHIINEETFGMFDRALDQLERTASLATLTSRSRGATSEDSDAEPDQSIHSLDSAQPASTPTTQEEQPIAEDPALRTRRERMTTLNRIISSLATFLSSPDPPPRSAFSSVRRAFDEITAILEQTRDEQPRDETLIDCVSTAQSLFWMLARRAYPETQTVDVAVRRSAPMRRPRSRSALRSSSRRWCGVGKRRHWK